jgi:hypothetical protein
MWPPIPGWWTADLCSIQTAASSIITRTAPCPAPPCSCFGTSSRNWRGSDLSGYFELVSKVDTGGLRSLEDIDSVGESRDYWSFPQQVLVRVFEKDPAAVVNLVSVGLADKIEFEEEKTAAAEWVAVPGRLVDVKIGGLTALEYTEHPPESLVNG